MCVYGHNERGSPIHWTDPAYIALFIKMSGWPSGLRRQTQGVQPSVVSTDWRLLVHVCGRGFESHF